MPDPRTETQLVILMDGQRVGIVFQGTAGRLTLEYDEPWRTVRDATPLSLSMPLASRRHEDSIVRPFLWGLLPDNERVLDRWARAYQVSPANPFALLRHVGEDCAGAAQLVVPHRVEPLLKGEGGVTWLDEDELAERLRILRDDPTSWHVRDDEHFSLAGAQAKTAFYVDQDTGRWGDPWGVVATTHIVKPAVSGLDEHDLNEHICLTAAGLAGLPVATSRVVTFGAERAIAVQRYDRLRDAAGQIRRVHQEDLCQALGVPPTSKYQNDGGPSPEQIIGLIRRAARPAVVAETDVGRFVDALAFNWIIAGTDAHAKNYSLLLAGGQVRLAPLYDIASALPYDHMFLPRLRMAMRIGGEYRVAGVSGRHWRRFAQLNGLDPDATAGRVAELTARIPDCFSQAARAGAVRALRSTLPARLVERVAKRASDCRTALARD